MATYSSKQSLRAKSRATAYNAQHMTETEALARRATSFLFVEGGTLPRHKLANLIGCAAEDLPAVFEVITAQLSGTGLSLVATDTQAALTTAASEAPAVRDVLKAALDKDVGDAGLEVLAVILYRGASTRAQIDYIRGVNTSSTIRALLSRGLLVRVENPADARAERLQASPELLAHLGVTRTEDLPDYATIVRELAAFEESKQESSAGPFGMNHGTNVADTDGRADGSATRGSPADAGL